MKIVIVDDHTIMRRGMALVVQHGFPDADVVEAGVPRRRWMSCEKRPPTWCWSTSGCRT